MRTPAVLQRKMCAADASANRSAKIGLEVFFGAVVEKRWICVL